MLYQNNYKCYIKIIINVISKSLKMLYQNNYKCYNKIIINVISKSL